MTGFDRYLVAAARAVALAWRYALPARDLALSWSRSCSATELHERETWLFGGAEREPVVDVDVVREIWAAACRDELAKVEALIAAADEPTRLDLQAIAARGLRTTPTAWHAAIVTRAGEAALEYEQGLLTDGELATWTWARAAVEGTIDRAVIAEVVAASYRARALAESLRSPQLPTDDGKGLDAYGRKALDAALAEPAEKGPRVAVRQIRKLATAGRIAALCREVDRLETVFGAPAVAAAWNALEVLSYYPGRSQALLERVDDASSDDRLHLARGLLLDGHVAAARAQANLAFADPTNVMDETHVVLAAPLFMDADERPRLASVLEHVLARIPDEPGVRSWIEQPLVAPPSIAHARSPGLEAHSLDDDQALAVYGDWLGSQGDPRGELISLALRGWHGEAELHLERYRDHFVGPLSAFERTLDGTTHRAFGWANGFIRSVRLGYHLDCGPAEHDLVHAIDAVFGHPSGAMIRNLTLTIDVTEGTSQLQRAIAALSRHDLRSLRTLRLGEFRHAGLRSPRDAPSCEISWAELGTLAALWPRLSRLEQLTLHGSLAIPILEGIDLPALHTLRIFTGGMAGQNTRALTAASWPALETLELWFGQTSYGCTTTLEDVLPFLIGERMPVLRGLGLCNADFADDLVPPLADSQILPRLSELSLALGTLSDEGAARLAARAGAFAQLDVIDLEGNQMSDAGIELVSGLCADVRTDEQRDIEDGRFTSVGE